MKSDAIEGEGRYLTETGRFSLQYRRQLAAFPRAMSDMEGGDRSGTDYKGEHGLNDVAILRRVGQTCQGNVVSSVDNQN